MASTIDTGTLLPEPGLGLSRRDLSDLFNAAKADIEALQARLSLLDTSPHMPVDYYGTVNRSFGSDCSAVFNLAISSTVAAGQVLWVPPGNYLLTSPLYVQSGMRMICSPRARFMARINGGGTTGVFMNQDAAAAMTAATRPNDGLIEGGIWGVDADLVTDATSGYTVSQSKGWECTIFNVFVDDFTFKDITVDRFPVQRGMQICGDNNTVINPQLLYPSVIYTGTGNSSGGIRYGGGKNFRCFGGYVVSADDALQLVPFAVGGTWGDLTIENARYIGTVGVALKNRLMAAVLSGCSTASILNSGWDNCTGKAAGKLIGIENVSPNAGASTGKIDKVFASNYHVEDIGVYDQNFAIDVLAVIGSGGCGEIAFINGDLTNCKNRPILISGDIDHIIFDKCTFPAPNNTDVNSPAFIRGAKRVTITGCKFKGGVVADVLTIGGNSTATYTGPVSNVTVRDTVIESVPSGAYALRIVNCTGGFIENLVFTEAAAGGNGLQITNTCSRVAYDHINASGVTGTKISDSGTSSTAGVYW